MKKISKSEILELDETLETDSSSKLFCDKPYRIERLEKMVKLLGMVIILIGCMRIINGMR
jgi:hypothetical protein